MKGKKQMIGFLLEYLALQGGNPNWAFDWWRFEMEGVCNDEDGENRVRCSDSN